MFYIQKPGGPKAMKQPEPSEFLQCPQRPAKAWHWASTQSPGLAVYTRRVGLARPLWNALPGHGSARPSAFEAPLPGMGGGALLHCAGGPGCTGRPGTSWLRTCRLRVEASATEQTPEPQRWHPAAQKPLLTPRCTPGGTGDGSSAWVPATHVGEPRASSRLGASTWPSADC